MRILITGGAGFIGSLIANIIFYKGDVPLYHPTLKRIITEIPSTCPPLEEKEGWFR